MKTETAASIASDDSIRRYHLITSSAHHFLLASLIPAPPRLPLHVRPIVRAYRGEAVRQTDARTRA